jgi:predicted metal-dependent phosphoesterase TrpH
MKKTMRIDHHLHTTRLSPDSDIDPFELVERAKLIGLDGVVITEHDELWNESDLAELRAHAGSELLVLAGCEISALEGHFLVYGLPSLGSIEPGIPLAELLEIVKGYEAAIVAAHPYRWGQDFDEILAEVGPVFQGLELVSNNVMPEMRRKTEALLQRVSIPATGSSDAHQIEVLGCYHSIVKGRVETMRDFVRALHQGAFRPGQLPEAFLVSGPVEKMKPVPESL